MNILKNIFAVAILCVASLATAYAADSTVANMQAATTLTGTELFYCIQGGADRNCTTTQVRAVTGTANNGMAIGASNQPVDATTLSAILFPDFTQSTASAPWRFTLSSTSTGFLFKNNSGINLFEILPAQVEAIVPFQMIPASLAPTSWVLATNAQVIQTPTWTGTLSSTPAAGFFANYYNHTFNNAGAGSAGYGDFLVKGTAGANANANLYVMAVQAFQSADNANSMELHAGSFTAFVSNNMTGTTADAIGLKAGVQVNAGLTIKAATANEAQYSNANTGLINGFGYYSQFTGTANATTEEAAYGAFGNGGTVSWKTIFGVGIDNTWQNAACGSGTPCTILGWLGASGASAMAIGTGIDFTKFTTSGNFYQDPNVTISGSGVINAVSYKGNGTAGVACSGTPTSSFASVGGIVTHC